MHYVRDKLAVCGFLDIGTRRKFEAHRFDAQLQCAEPFDTWLKECVDVKSLPFDDGAPIPKALFDEAQNWLLGYWHSGSKILISCAGGQSRSVTMAIALLCIQSGSRFMGSVLEVMSRIPDAYPHPHVLVSAAKHCGDPLHLHELESIYAQVQKTPPYPWPAELMQDAINATKS